jgi:hypothetical protein
MKTKTELLAGQALDTIVPYTWTKLDYEQIHELLAYHAELIVKECAKAYHTTRSIDTPIEQHFRNHLGIK